MGKYSNTQNDFNKQYYLSDYLDIKQCNPKVFNFNNKVIYLWEEEIDNQKDEKKQNPPMLQTPIN